MLEHNLDPRPPAGLGVTWMWAEGRGAAAETKDRDAERELRQLLARLPAGLPREAKLTRGPIDLGLLQVATLLPADLIVMGSHGGSSAEHRSLTEAIVEAAPCPVLTLTESSADAPFLAAAFPVKLHFLHVTRGRFHRSDLDSDRRQLEALVPEGRREAVQLHVEVHRSPCPVWFVTGALGEEGGRTASDSRAPSN